MEDKIIFGLTLWLDKHDIPFIVHYTFGEPKIIRMEFPDGHGLEVSEINPNGECYVVNRGFGMYLSVFELAEMILGEIELCKGGPK